MILNCQQHLSLDTFIYRGITRNPILRIKYVSTRDFHYRIISNKKVKHPQSKKRMKLIGGACTLSLFQCALGGSKIGPYSRASLRGLAHDPAKHVRAVRYHESFEKHNKNYGVPLVNIDGKWGTICFDGLDKDTRDFLCRQLYFPDSYWGSSVDRYQSVSHFHQALIEYPVLLNGLKCIKHASEFDDCTSEPMGLQHCESQQDLLLGCTPVN